MWEAVAWISCVLALCGSGVYCYCRWLAVQPPCTAEEFARVVKQLNQLTVDFSEIKATTDSVRSAVAMTRIGR